MSRQLEGAAMTKARPSQDGRALFLIAIPSTKMGLRGQYQMLSVKLRSLSEREGCLSLRSALASI
jgi:hypothetical protein